jgi:hypothetical protein
MLSFVGPQRLGGNGVLRRDVLTLGSLGIGGLTLSGLLQGQAAAKEATGQSPARQKSVINIWMRGGPSHIDSFDMKPDAPPEIRGEFKPIATNVPGIQLCEYLPKLATMMDRLAIIRGYKANDLGDHTPHYILTGSGDRGKRPSFGSIVSYLQPRSDGMPPYVSLMYERPGLYHNEASLYLGPQHLPFSPKSEGLANLRLVDGISMERLQDRKELLGQFDAIQRQVDQKVSKSEISIYTEQALRMIASPRVRDAFNVNQEPQEVHDRYGKYCENFLRARRLVEAGVNVVTLKVGDWDTHEHNFRDMRDQLPQLDVGFHALISDLYDRGLENDVAVVLWGEFGRAPKISRIAGRDHWPEAGAAVIAGGGFKTGQAIGETDSHGGRSNVRPYTPGDVLATLYRYLGIDPAIAILDHNRRPVHVLDEREYVKELI